MNDGFIVISEKDWEKASPEQRAWWTYTALQRVGERFEKIDNCIEQLQGSAQKTSTIKNALLFAGSLVGGALMILVLVLLGVKVGH